MPDAITTPTLSHFAIFFQCPGDKYIQFATTTTDALVAFAEWLKGNLSPDGLIGAIAAIEPTLLPDTVRVLQVCIGTAS